MICKKDSAIAFNLISRQKLDAFSSHEKLEYIIKEVKKGKILVLEQGLTPVEQTSLIESTMREIDHDTFIGIEMEGYGEDKISFFQRVLGLIKRPRMTIIGPADLLQMVHKDNDSIETVIVAGRGAK
jgi:hypothetical protein